MSTKFNYKRCASQVAASGSVCGGCKFFNRCGVINLLKVRRGEELYRSTSLVVSAEKVQTQPSRREL